MIGSDRKETFLERFSQAGNTLISHFVWLVMRFAMP